MAKEISRSELVDRWSEERFRIARELEERLPLLLQQVEQVVNAMRISSHLRRSDFREEKINPVVDKWLQGERDRLSREIHGSFELALPKSSQNSSELTWQGSEYLTFGAATAFTAAPLAALPFVGSMIVGGGFFTAASLAAVPTAIVVGGAVALGLGPTVRGWATDQLQDNLRQSLHKELTLLVLGDPTKREIPSLKGTLFQEIDAHLNQFLADMT